MKRPPRSSTRAKDVLGSAGEGEQREAAEEEFGLNIQGRVQKESLPRAKEAARRAQGAARRRLPCTYAKMRSTERDRQRPTSISIIIDCQFGAQTWEGRREGAWSQPPLLHCCAAAAAKSKRDLLLPARCPHSFMRDPRVTGSTGRTFGQPPTRAEVGRPRQLCSVKGSQNYFRVREVPSTDPPNYISHTLNAPPHFCVSTHPTR